MTEGKKKTLLKLGIILVVLTVAVLAMAGTGAAELKDVSNEDSITIQYMESPEETTTGTSSEPEIVTKTLTKDEYASFFGTSRIWTFESAKDINDIAEKTKSDDWKHNVTYIQVADIDCTGIDMKSIPGWVYNFNIFGNGHIITNYTQSGENAHGLIECAGHAKGSIVVIDSVIMRNCWINNDSTGRVGGIVGRFENGILALRGCKLENSTVGSYKEHYGGTSGDMSDAVGGLVGMAESQVMGENIVKTVIDGAIDWKSLIKPFIKLIGGDLSDYYKPSYLKLEGCSVTQCEIINYMSRGIDLGKSDVGYVGGLLGRSADNKCYVYIGYCNVEDCKIAGSGQYVGGFAGQVNNVTLENVDHFVDNCIIESANGSVGGLFGCAKNVAAKSTTDLYTVTNTAILSGDAYNGVIIGDVSKFYKASIPNSYLNKVHAKNVLVSGTNGTIFGTRYSTQIQCPGYDTSNNNIITYYLDRGVYYTEDTKTENYSKYDSFTTYDARGTKLSTSTYKNISHDFIDIEYRYHQVSKVTNGSTVIADLGHYGTEDGYGYFPSRPVTVTFTQTTEYYEENVPKTKVDERTVVAYTNRRIALPDPLFIKPEDYSEDKYTFSGWFTNEELTESWNFENDTVPHPLGINFYSKLTDTKGKQYYDIEYHNGSEVTSETHVECYKPHALNVLGDTEYVLFQGWNTKEDGTGTFYEKGDYISWRTEDKLVLYAEWKDIPTYTVTFTTDDSSYGSVSTTSISDVPEGTTITVNGDTVVIGSYGSSTALPASSNYEFSGWSTVPEKVMSNLTIKANFTKKNTDLLIINDKISFDTVEKESELPDKKVIAIVNNTDSDVTVEQDSVKDFNYWYYQGENAPEDIASWSQGLPSEIICNSQMNILVQPLSETIGTAGEYRDEITLTYNGDTQVKILASVSVIDQVPEEKKKNVVIPVSPEVYITDYVQSSTGKDYPVVTAAKDTRFFFNNNEDNTTKATIESMDNKVNLKIKIDNIQNNTYTPKAIYLDSDDIITVEYPEVKSNDGDSCSVVAGVKSLNDDLPTISGAEDIDTRSLLEDGYILLCAISSLNKDTDTINENLKNISMDYKIPQEDTIQDASHIHVLHVDSDGMYDDSGITINSAILNEETEMWEISADSTEGFSSYVVAYHEDISRETTKRSTVTAFFGENDGNAFTFENAVVITKAVLPGAESVTITNTDGSGWYTCNIDADGFTGNGTVYFQVPLDVIEVKGYTVNDVSFLGETTKYLGSDDRYAKYTSTLDKAGAHTIDFEKGAAATGVEDTPVVTPSADNCKITITGASALKVGEKFNLSAACSCGKVHNYNWTISDPTVATVTELGVLNGLKVGTVTVTVTDEDGHSASKVVTVAAKETQTAAKSPFPVLSILAGLGIAGIVALRRK